MPLGAKISKENQKSNTNLKGNQVHWRKPSGRHKIKKEKEKIKPCNSVQTSQDRIDWKSNQPLGALGPLLKNTWLLFLALGHNFDASARLFEGTKSLF